MRIVKSFFPWFLSFLFFATIAVEAPYSLREIAREPALYQQAGLFSFLARIFGLGSGSSNPSQDGTSVTRTRSPREPYGGTYINAGYERMPANTSRSFTLHQRPCRNVNNQRTLDGAYSLMIPRQTAAEWDSFLANAPPDVTLSQCNCGVPVPDSVLWGIAELMAQYNALFPLPPAAYTSFGLSARPETVNKVCEMLGCGAATVLSTRPYSSPGNNAIMRWNGTSWEKFSASLDNYKLGCQSGCPTIRCAPL
jgi:hypothetical protein